MEQVIWSVPGSAVITSGFFRSAAAMVANRCVGLSSEKTQYSGPAASQRVRISERARYAPSADFVPQDGRLVLDRLARGRGTPGPPMDEVVTWGANGRSRPAGLTPGDRVALHGNWVGDVISATQGDRLDRLEAGRLTGR